MLNLNSVMVFSQDPKKLADFYGKFFEKNPEWSEGGYYGFQAGKTILVVGPHDKVRGRSTNPERLILNFETPDVAGECERVKKLGAAAIAEPYHPAEDPNATIATFADPDGNYIQLVTPWEAA